RWAADGQSLYLVGEARGATNVVQLTLDGTLSDVTTGQHHLVGFSVDRAGNTFALALADTQQPGDIFVHWVDSGDTTRLTDINHDILAEVRLSTPEEFTFTGAKGWEIEGWIMRPHDFDPGTDYPLILEIHGGPETAYGYTFVLEFQLLAAQGYIVVYSNPRGSTGYGREFTQAVRGIWGQDDYADMMAAVDAVIARGSVDTERLGVTGGSYGGIMTNWIVGHTDRFKAAVTQRSISNLASFFGTSDVGPWYSINHWDGAPWQTPERHAFHSPLTYVEKINTPLLIIHSEQDWRCPISEAEQLFAALKWLRRDTEFLRFEGSDHDLSRNGHPRLRIDRLNAIQEWFTRYIPTGTATNAHAGTANGVGDLAEMEPVSSHI
nr:S9 family peptidase [Ktedonobacterales bacterium]